MTRINTPTTPLWPTQLLKRRISSSSTPPLYPNVLAGLLIVTLIVSVTITSSAFEKKMQPARHRMVYALLKEEMAREGGIHALQLRTKTPAEEERENQRGQ